MPATAKINQIQNKDSKFNLKKKKKLTININFHKSSAARNVEHENFSK